ncbi:MAG: hypothetical protein ACKO38_11100 [Planctomycetota bacterium]
MESRRRAAQWWRETLRASILAGCGFATGWGLLLYPAPLAAQQPASPSSRASHSSGVQLQAPLNAAAKGVPSSASPMSGAQATWRAGTGLAPRPDLRPRITMEATSGVRVRLRDGASPISKPATGLVRRVSNEQAVDEPRQDPFGDRAAHSSLSDIHSAPADSGQLESAPVESALVESAPVESGDVELNGPISNRPVSKIAVGSRVSAPSSRVTSSRAASSHAASSRVTSSRATSSRATAGRSTSSQPEDGGTFAAAERGQGVASGVYRDNSSDASAPNHAQDELGGDGQGNVDESTSGGASREQFADGQVADDQIDARGIDARGIDDQVADGQTQFADEQIADAQPGDGQIGDAQISDEANSGSLAEGADIAGDGTSTRMLDDGDDPMGDAGPNADGEDLNAVADSGASVENAPESSTEVLEQGVPFAEGEGENADNVGGPAVADSAPSPAPVLIGDRGPAKALRVLPNVMPVSAPAGLTRRVLPMGPPSNIPHRSLPALPPRKVEAKTTADVVVAATGTSTAASTGVVAPASNAGNVVLTAAQPGPAGPPPAAGESGETPLRNAAFCRRLYNERNCCSDENACNDHRAHVKSHPLSKISLDITPTCNLTSRQEGNQANCGFPFEQSPSRIWRDRKGVEVARGRVTGFAHLRVEVTDDKGIPTRIRLRDLNEDDICFLAAWCGVPSECRLDDVALAARNWTPITMTWKASSLCHKPLYFEEEQLERYGHTMGPFAQPAVSGAHFFANIALLPYNMGIHPMSECQYALGYYRPGSCAPWMIPPFPLSARGALAETGVILGGVYLIP